MNIWFKVRVGLFALVLLSVPASAERLTGIGLFGAFAGGTSDLSYWNTRGGDIWFNLYLKDGGSWVNSGDSSASIDIPLSRGVYTYELFAQVGITAKSYVGLNLFFDGNGDDPLISGLIATDTFSPIGLNVIPNSSLLTPNLPGDAIAAGAGTLQFFTNGLNYQLSAFSLYKPNSAPAPGDSISPAVGNYVRPYNNTPDILGSKDYHGYFTLLVTPEPSPGLLAGLGLGLLALAARFRRRRSSNA